MDNNYMKTILSGVKEWTENLTDGAHSNWNQNNSTAAGYIENRPFYTGDPVETVLVEESTVSFVDTNQGLYAAEFDSTFAPTVGETYKVSWDGTVYECTCVGEGPVAVIGNLSLAGEGSDTGEPFLMIIMNGTRIQIGTADTSDTHTFSISGFVAEIVKIEEKYLPDALTSKISTLSSDVSTLSNNASALSKKVSTLSSNVSSLSSSVNAKMNNSNPTGSGSFSLNRKANTTIGLRSFAEGYETTASGARSHAEGNETTASGIGSHAEGEKTTASGKNSHAEGNGTTASGIGSHAEGEKTIASGNYSHAEGKETTASSDYSHAEGGRTTALSTSHAEGSSTNVYSAFVTVEDPTEEDIITAWKINKFSVARAASHVEGNNNLAIGNFSHAEGKETTASGDYSHAKGFKTVASGIGSHAEGYGTTASGNYSHAEGQETTASGARSHAEGERTTASDIDSHAEGNGTTASGIGSHAEGEKTTTSGRASHAEGFQTTASGKNSHAEGYATTASSDYQHVQGKYNIEDPSGTYADIVGNGALGRRSNAYTLDWEGNAWYSGTIEGKALILPSSTAGSTKKFKITVDDSGTIAATEVV